MNAAVALSRLGGAATYVELADLAGRSAIRRAVKAKHIHQQSRGTYVLAEADAARLAAVRSRGALALTSAALAHGWKVKVVPERPFVCVAPGRNVDARLSRAMHVRRAPLSADELAERVTSPTRTVVDCARFLPFDEALAVADSALRADVVGPRELLDAAERSPRTGRAKAIRVATYATHLADNPMESVLRAICLEISQLRVEPQVWVTDDERVDLADMQRGLVIEAESYEFHGTRAAYRRDVRRYTEFTRAGWTVLRFCWEDIMLRPEYVRSVIRDVLELPTVAQERPVRARTA